MQAVGRFGRSVPIAPGCPFIHRTTTNIIGFLFNPSKIFLPPSFDWNGMICGFLFFFRRSGAIGPEPHGMPRSRAPRALLGTPPHAADPHALLPVAAPPEGVQRQRRPLPRRPPRGPRPRRRPRPRRPSYPLKIPPKCLSFHSSHIPQLLHSHHQPLFKILQIFPNSETTLNPLTSS